MTYLLFAYIFLFAILSVTFYDTVINGIIRLEESIKMLYKNIDRKSVEVRNILEQILIVVKAQSEVESNTIADVVKAQNPNVPNFSLIIGSLEAIKHTIPSLNSNNLFNNYYNQIITLEKEITDVIYHKDELIALYNRKVRNPLSKWAISFNNYTVVNFDK